jgi:poly-gamma-glutamate synthesis protein (capsule biosynthesis protein)
VEKDSLRAGGYDYSYPFSQLNTFEPNKYDAWMTSFECPITDNVVPFATQVSNLVFNCRPEFLPEATKYFQFFDLANNHTGDQQGSKGLESTRQYLDKAGVQYFGSFDPGVTDDICEVVALPVRIEQSDKTEQKAQLPVAMCAWHYFMRGPEPGEIEHMQQYAKIMPVLAFVEMGVEYQPTASAIQQKIAHAVVDQGPEFVIANNPHWVQNTEVYKGKLIVYATGNFIFDQLEPEEQRSASLDVTMTVPYDQNVGKWVALAKDCVAFQDSCLATAQKQGLKKIKPHLTYGVVAGQGGYRHLTHKADAATQAAVEQRMNWQQTLKQLGQ